MFSPSSFSYLMDWFHNFNCSLLFGVLVFVVMIFLFLSFNNLFFISSKIEYQFFELMCSVIPVLILLFQMFPSLGLLYFYGLMNMDSDLTVKVLGHQWYWSYEIGDSSFFSFDSYMKSQDMLFIGDCRLLDVDNRCVVPCNTDIRFCVSSSDVIHSWTISNFFIKLDAISGILSVFFFSFPIIGVYYGQCSEICGANHSFMPIVLEVTIFDMFKYWCMSFYLLFYYFKYYFF